MQKLLWRVSRGAALVALQHHHSRPLSNSSKEAGVALTGRVAMTFREAWRGIPQVQVVDMSFPQFKNGGRSVFVSSC